jgi:aspartate carbamoyltransferase catalytic subunit
MFPSVDEYATMWGLNNDVLALASPECIVMHPGPMNRGIEIAQEVADGDRAVILEQVTNGVAVRMACLYLLSGGEHQPSGEEARATDETKDPSNKEMV